MAGSGPTLMSIPLELRHQIFEYASSRGEAPKKVLRRWFEKKEVKELIAQAVANDPSAPTPIASYDTRDPYEEDTDIEEAEAEEEEEQEDEHSDSENEEQEDEDAENEDEDDGMDDGVQDDGGDEDAEAEDDEMDEPAEVQDDGEAMDEADETQDAVTDAANNVQGQAEVMDEAEENPQGTVPDQAGDSTVPQADEDADEDMDVDNVEGAGAESNVADNGDSDEEDAAGGDGVAVDDGNNAVAVPQTAAPPPPPPPPQPQLIRPHHKWRHIPKFLRVSQSPPPPELFLTCKELNGEAKDWYYDVTNIRIDATASFQHFSMFEHLVDQIVNAAFSPFENIRKVEVKFVWDTEWIRAHAEEKIDFFDMLLQMRAEYVVDILWRAPELKELVIDWHDSINDNLSAAVKLNIFEKFTNLAEEKLMQEKPKFITVNTNEHYLEAGKKPHRKSILGRKRIEFQAFADAGIEFK